MSTRANGPTAGRSSYLVTRSCTGCLLVLGDRVVDVPRRDALYDDLPAEERARLYGRGFTLYGRLPDPAPDRQRGRMGRVDAGDFDAVVIADIHRNWAPWVALRPKAAAAPPSAA